MLWLNAVYLANHHNAPDRKNKMAALCDLAYHSYIATRNPEQQMALTLEQRMQVYRALDSEANKAAKAAAKAEKAYNDAPAAYGGSVEREEAAVLLSLRNAQRDAAYAAASAYFNAYIKDAS